MVSFLRKGLEYKVEKLKYKKLGGYSAKDQNQIRTSSWQIDHPRSVHTKSTSSQGFSLKQWVARPTHLLREKPWERVWHQVLQSLFIKTIYHFLVKNN